MLSEEQGLSGDALASGARQSPARGEREVVRLGSSGYRGRGSRIVTIRVSGVVDQSTVHSGASLIRIPLSRLIEGLLRPDGLRRVTHVAVS